MGTTYELNYIFFKSPICCSTAIGLSRTAVRCACFLAAVASGVSLVPVNSTTCTKQREYCCSEDRWSSFGRSEKTVLTEQHPEQTPYINLVAAKPFWDAAVVFAFEGGAVFIERDGECSPVPLTTSLPLRFELHCFVAAVGLAFESMNVAVETSD